MIRRLDFMISVFGLTVIGLVPCAQSRGLDGYDFTLRGGYSAVTDNQTQFEIFGGISGPGTFEFLFDDSYAISAAVGRDFGEGWRAELDVSYRNYEADQYSLATGAGHAILATNAEVSIWSPLVRASYDVLSNDSWGLALGAGAGAVYATLSTAANGNTVEHQSWAVTGQVFTEARYCPSASLCAIIEYQYGFVEDLTIDDPSAVTDIYYRADILQQAVMGGIRYRFGK